MTVVAASTTADVRHRFDCAPVSNAEIDARSNCTDGVLQPLTPIVLQVRWSSSDCPKGLDSKRLDGHSPPPFRLRPGRGYIGAGGARREQTDRVAVEAARQAEHADHRSPDRRVCSPRFSGQRPNHLTAEPHSRLLQADAHGGRPNVLFLLREPLAEPH